MVPCSVLCSLKHPQYCCSVNWRDLGYKCGAEINNFKKKFLCPQDDFKVKSEWDREMLHCIPEDVIWTLNEFLLTYGSNWSKPDSTSGNLSISIVLFRL